MPEITVRLRDLIARATAFDGSPPFSDGALVDPTRTVMWLGPAAAIYSSTEAEFVVDPDARSQGHGTRLLEALLTDHDMLFWAHGDNPAARALAASHGLHPVRELLHLEAPVPPPEPDPGTPGTPAFAKRRSSDAPAAVSSGNQADSAPISVISQILPPGSGAEPVISEMRGYTPADADAWLELNARAFAGHPEQGAVTRADLDALTAEPWFDADDFLLLWDSGTLIGYCWLKVADTEGEFYVVGVSPDRQGEGLGRRLVEAGLTRLASRGIRTAHLYVEGDNTPALALYRSFGFTPRSVDVQYLWKYDTVR